jgi:hypothetical protein
MEEPHLWHIHGRNKEGYKRKGIKEIKEETLNQSY